MSPKALNSALRIKGGKMEKKRHYDSSPPLGTDKVIPVMEEQVHVEKRVRDTGITRIRKKIHEKVEVVDEPLSREEVQVDRVPINRFVDKPVPVRQEDGVLVVSILEEVLVTEKKLLLKEELHIRKRVKTVRKPQKITLRSEEAIVEHIDLEGQAKDERSGDRAVPTKRR
jgi:stress response protein YsnF